MWQRNQGIKSVCSLCVGNGKMRSTTPILQSTVHRRDKKYRVFHENNPGADGLSPGV